MIVSVRSCTIADLVALIESKQVVVAEYIVEQSTVVVRTVAKDRSYLISCIGDGALATTIKALEALGLVPAPARK